MIFFIINILITNKESMNWILQKKKKRKRIFEKFKHRENHQLRYQTSIKFISRRRLTISSVTKTFHNSPTCKRRGGRIRGIFDWWQLIGQAFLLSPRPSWAICVLYRRCFPPGEKACGTLYSWRRNGSLRLRRMKQRRIIYAPCGRVHKGQIF